MRWAGGAWALLLCVAAAGCPRPDGPFARLRPDRVPDRTAHSPLTPVQGSGPYVESVLVERPAGDSLLDRDLWVDTPTRLPPKNEVLLAENGLRVAILGGNLPPAFQKLLESEADTVNPHGLTFANRADAVIPTAELSDPCEYAVLATLDANRQKVKLQQARAGVFVRPEATPDGRVKLSVEPQVQHGEKQDFFRPTDDGTAFTVHGEIPLERYPGVGFEVVLGPDEYLVIGSTAQAKDALGNALFSTEASGRPRQRVLVIRTGIRGEAPSDLPAIPRLRGGRAIAAEAARW